MATSANEFAVSSPAMGETKPTLTQFVDRWIYVFMAALFVVTALVAFVPSSIFKVAAMQSGQRPWFPPAAHFHAAMMGSWLVLLLTQTWLVATGRGAFHQKLGMLSVALVPAMILAGFFLVVATHAELAEALAAASAGDASFGPAFARMTYLPTTVPDSYLAQDIYTLLWISPMSLWDLHRLRAIHPAYLIWLAAFVPLSAIVHYFWGRKPGWRRRGL